MRLGPPLLLASLAHAGTVAPVEMVFSDSVAVESRERLWAQLREGLAEQGFVLQDATAVREKLAGSALPAGCVIGPCLAEVGKLLGVEHVLVGRIEGVESSFDVTLTALETQQGAAVAQATERCDVCGMVDVEATVRRAGVTLGKGVLTSLKPKPKPKPEPVDLRKADKPPPAPPSWRGWKWVALGVGAAAVGVGTYLTQIDNRCLNDSCTDKRDTGTPGMIAVSTGVVLVGTAGYLFLFRF